MEIKLGQLISCNIGSTKIDEAKLQFENDYLYICQNILKGSDCSNKLGYIYSFAIYNGELTPNIIKQFKMKSLFLTQSQKLQRKNDI